MAIKKSKKMNISDIEEIAKQFYAAKKTADEQGKIAKELAEVLKQYASEQEEGWDGNTYRIGDQVRVERRQKVKSSYNEEALNEDWLETFVRRGGGEYIDVKFDDEALSTLSDPTLCDLMQQLNYEPYVETMLVVYKQK